MSGRDQNGNNETGWPKLNVASGMSYAQPVLADLDNDSDLEILHSYYSNNVDYVGIYHHNATNFANWPQTYPGPQTYVTPVTADIDNDADLEIFGGGHVFGGPSFSVRHHTGTQVNGWPVTVDMLECSPVICDVNNDGNREILVGDNLNPGNFFAFRSDGSIVTDWPISITSAAMVNSPAVGDVDRDGDIEIALVVRDGTVNLWTINSIPYKGYLSEWGTYFHDLWNTGWFHPRAPQNLAATGYPNYIRLIWMKNTEPDIAGYNIYRSQTSGGPYTKINTNLVIDTTYNDSTASPGITYYYCATALIKAFTESRLSNEASASIGIDEIQCRTFASISIIPNPFTHLLKFNINSGRYFSAKIYDIKGTLIDEIVGDKSIEWRPETSLPNGVYFVEVKTEKGIELKKTIKID